MRADFVMWFSSVQDKKTDFRNTEQCCSFVYLQCSTLMRRGGGRLLSLFLLHAPTQLRDKWSVSIVLSRCSGPTGEPDAVVGVFPLPAKHETEGRLAVATAPKAARDTHVGDPAALRQSTRVCSANHVKGPSMYARDKSISIINKIFWSQNRELGVNTAANLNAGGTLM